MRSIKVYFYDRQDITFDTDDDFINAVKNIFKKKIYLIIDKSGKGVAMNTNHILFVEELKEAQKK